MKRIFFYTDGSSQFVKWTTNEAEKKYRQKCFSNLETGWYWF